MIYTARIGPFSRFQGGSACRFVGVTVRLKDGAVKADLEDDNTSEIIQFIKMKSMKKPTEEKALAGILAFVCAQTAASKFTGGTLAITAGLGSHNDFNIHDKDEDVPARPKDFFDNRCEAWCEPIS